MTPEQQRKADHLALVAALMFALWRAHADWDHESDATLRRVVLDAAESLQKAAEERVGQ